MNTPTPGPYPLKITQVDDLIVIVTNQGNLFANTFDPAAARLIAAAPELLAALDGIMQWWMETESGDDMPMDLFDRAHAALAKSKGGVK
jgi:hypothetical protein